MNLEAFIGVMNKGLNLLIDANDNEVSNLDIIEVLIELTQKGSAVTDADIAEAEDQLNAIAPEPANAE